MLLEKGMADGFFLSFFSNCFNVIFIVFFEFGMFVIRVWLGIVWVVDVVFLVELEYGFYGLIGCYIVGGVCKGCCNVFDVC